MKTLVNSIIVITLSLFCVYTSEAQDRKFSHQGTIGVGSVLLDESLSFHLAYNPGFYLRQNLDLLGQVSYSSSKITSAFLSGARGSLQSLNVLVGPRIYLRKEVKKFRPYFMLLVGINGHVEERNGETRPPVMEFGLCSGIMAEIDHFIFGFSVETPGVMALRLGYKI